MSPELNKELRDRYPLIFAQPCEISCGDGWFNILDSLCGCVQNYLDWQSRQSTSCEQVVAEQIKEKFGTLRFYYRGGDATVAGMIQVAECISGVTCERCGAPGTTGGQGWIRTLCARHHAERQQ